MHQVIDHGRMRVGAVTTPQSSLSAKTGGAARKCCARAIHPPSFPSDCRSPIIERKLRDAPRLISPKASSRPREKGAKWRRQPEARPFRDGNNGTFCLDELVNLTPNVQSSCCACSMADYTASAAAAKSASMSRIVAATNMNLEQAVQEGPLPPATFSIASTRFQLRRPTPCASA